MLNPLWKKAVGAFRYLACDGPAGGCQGKVIQPNDVPSRLGPISYGASNMADNLVESFAGPHDWLSDRVGMYDALGNGIHRAGFDHYLYEGLSYGLIPVASPFSAAALIDTTGITNSLYYVGREVR